MYTDPLEKDEYELALTSVIQNVSIYIIRKEIKAESISIEI